MLWVCIGDLNEITCLGEKSGGPIKPERQMKKFRECLDFYALKDLSFSRFPFTWCNKHFDGSVVWLRLDRGLAFTDWMLKFLSV